MPSNIFYTVCGTRQKFITDLRRFRNEGLVGRFTVNRDALERVIQNRKEQDAVLDMISYTLHIEETDDGTVTIRIGDDVIDFRVQRDVKCDFNEKEKIGKVFDKVVGKVIPTTS
ncbi:hypothetical protein HOLleu_13769 [Holothuria leucospilota]|uniref:Uncharacterized protein n=1 Tax=Holothuria leucospilota TaxID=206669 RepID=A0A9Q1HBT2_HOLLE|nr:hypothetical protein HOLleu_13769 [Holothuria leucospilota]